LTQPRTTKRVAEKVKVDLQHLFKRAGAGANAVRLLQNLPLPSFSANSKSRGLIHKFQTLYLEI
jgi:hypothetical protein